MRISDWSSDVCSSDLDVFDGFAHDRKKKRMMGDRKTIREGRATTQCILLIAQCDLLRSFNKHTTVGATAHSSVGRVSGRFLAHANCIISEIPPIPFAKFEKKLAIPRYDEASIRVLKGSVPVRTRLGRYTCPKNHLHSLQEDQSSEDR